MTLWTLLMFIAGAVLLIGGAEMMVRGASRLAVSVGISPLVVGLTVVALGTSSPELAVTVGSAFAGEADMALGNVVGSNIFNILVVIGLSAVAAPLVVSSRLVRWDVPIMIVVSVAVLVMALDGAIGRGDGLILFVALIAYIYVLIRGSRSEKRGVQEEFAEAYEASDAEAAAGGSRLRQVVMIVVGLVLLVIGADWLVDAAVATAVALGVSSLVIGLTIVAAGTSLPEVATSVLATIRGERDIAVGNAIGSNLFNLLGVLGLGAIIAPAGITVPRGALAFDIPVMIVVAIAALPIFFTGYSIARWEGAVFLAYYVAYTVYLILDARDHHALANFQQAMVMFFIPITLLTLLVTVQRAVKRQRRSTR